MSAPRKIVLAYSGGLDTSVILKWLQVRFGCPVVAYCADVGQGGELESARRRAEQLGAEAVVVEDLREQFASEYVYPMFRANAVYEGAYLLGSSIARPLIAARQVAAAYAHGADALAHGATGKGNDQVRFELAYLAIAPEMRVIAPWREWDFDSRGKLLEFAAANGIEIASSGREGAEGPQRPPYSTDANLLHVSYEGGELEDPATAPAQDMWQRTVDPRCAPDNPQDVEIAFEAGDPVALDGDRLLPADMLAKLNGTAGAHGIGRLDVVESRFIGMKSRGCYETPGGTLLLAARRALESVALDREVIRLRDDLMPRYAALVYNGFWFSPERELLQGMFDASQRPVTGTVTARLYKGSVTIRARAAKHSLHDLGLSTFEGDGGAFDQRDATGFIRLNALRLRLSRLRGRSGGDS